MYQIIGLFLIFTNDLGIFFVIEPNLVPLPPQSITAVLFFLNLIFSSYKIVIINF